MTTGFSFSLAEFEMNELYLHNKGYSRKKRYWLKQQKKES